jgi:hypothetical protein
MYYLKNELRTVMKDERVGNLLARGEIKWQFNLSRVPWWGGQFERMMENLLGF